MGAIRYGRLGHGSVAALGHASLGHGRLQHASLGHGSMSGVKPFLSSQASFTSWFLDALNYAIYKSV